mmetsp:Transcript_183/g.462  ORF Transcript_183/g.462 Transcript_183/m.462 type:complete len:281 (-) Transcript_183:245-1087(-)
MGHAGHTDIAAEIAAFLISAAGDTQPCPRSGSGTVQILKGVAVVQSLLAEAFVHGGEARRHLSIRGGEGSQPNLVGKRRIEVDETQAIEEYVRVEHSIERRLGRRNGRIGMKHVPRLRRKPIPITEILVAANRIGRRTPRRIGAQPPHRTGPRATRAAAAPSPPSSAFASPDAPLARAAHHAEAVVRPAKTGRRAKGVEVHGRRVDFGVVVFVAEGGGEEEGVVVVDVVVVVEGADGDVGGFVGVFVGGVWVAEGGGCECGCGGKGCHCRGSRGCGCSRG